MPTLTGGQILVEYLIKEGVPYVIGIPGHGDMGLFDAFKGRTEIKVLQARHEQSAAHIADGYFRVRLGPFATLQQARDASVSARRFMPANDRPFVVRP